MFLFVFFLITYITSATTVVTKSVPTGKEVISQQTKKVVSDSPGLVDFAIGLVIFLSNLPDGQVLFREKNKLQKDGNQSYESKKVLGLVGMTCGLVHASYSLPE